MLIAEGESLLSGNVCSASENRSGAGCGEKTGEQNRSIQSAPDGNDSGLICCDENGLITGTDVAQTLKEGTVTFGYDPIKNFELRIEGRYDRSTQDPFLRAISPNADFPSTFANSQTEFALQGVYKF